MGDKSDADEITRTAHRLVFAEENKKWHQFVNI
jgi:hypothetical protein